MAIDPLRWAMKLLPLLANDAQRVVLTHLAWRANDDGLLWPSVADMSMELGKGTKAIRRALKELDQEELLNINEDFRDDGSQGSNYYQLLLNVTPQELLKRRKDRIGIMSTERKRFEDRMSKFYERLELWGRALHAIKNEINPRTFDTWYAPLRFRGINKRSLILGTPAESFDSYFRDGRNKRIILDAAKTAFKGEVDLIAVYFRQLK